jgi:DNA-binding MarR family transcriptional regulator
MEQGEKQLIELVNAWGAYREGAPHADIAGFCLHYLTERTQPQNASPLENPSDEFKETKWVEPLSGLENASRVAIRPEDRLGALIGRLSSYAYFYSKKAMQPFPFKSVDDPVYLIMLVQLGTPKKSELIYEMLSEFASGIDIINRLVSMNLVEEFPDEHDRRSKRLRITTEGLAALTHCFPVMKQLSDVTFGSLSTGEKALLVQLLDKLDRYHADHYRQSKNADFEEVYARMTGK